jgi:hypothetical protein
MEAAGRAPKFSKSPPMLTPCLPRLTAVAVAVALVVACEIPVRADVVYSTPGVAYTQNFDSLNPTQSTSLRTWTNDSTITGWFASKTSYRSDDGSNATDGLYGYGTAGNTDRALGSSATQSVTTTTPILFGVRLTNATGVTLRNVTITYDGEQWRDAAIAGQSLTFAYLVGDGPTLSLPGFIDVPALNFLSPVHTNADAALDGNLAANRTAGITQTFDLNSDWLPGDELFLRWSDANSSGHNHGLGIDNLSVVGRVQAVVAVPEASALLLCGAVGGVMGAWSLRRRRQGAPLSSDSAAKSA